MATTIYTPQCGLTEQCVTVLHRITGQFSGRFQQSRSEVTSGEAPRDGAMRSGHERRHRIGGKPGRVGFVTAQMATVLCASYGRIIDALDGPIGTLVDAAEGIEMLLTLGGLIDPIDLIGTLCDAVLVTTLGPRAAYHFNAARGYYNAPQGVRSYGPDDYDVLALVCLSADAVVFTTERRSSHRVAVAALAGLRADPRASLEECLVRLGLDPRDGPGPATDSDPISDTDLLPPCAA